MKCIHSGCGGELEPYEHPKRENAILFKCNKCQCIFTLTSVTKAVGCPSLKETKTKSESQSLSTTDASIKRKRGRPRNASNKVST